MVEIEDMCIKDVAVSDTEVEHSHVKDSFDHNERLRYFAAIHVLQQLFNVGSHLVFSILFILLKRGSKHFN